MNTTWAQIEQIRLALEEIHKALIAISVHQGYRSVEDAPQSYQQMVHAAESLAEAAIAFSKEAP